MSEPLLTVPVQPDWETLVACILRKGTPRRVHHIELFLDQEIKDAVCAAFNVLDGLDQDDADFPFQREIRTQRFLGYDYVRQGIDGLDMPFHRSTTTDTAGLQRAEGRSFVDESRGPITSWEEFERFPWPRIEDASTRALEWYQRNLPDDMCIIAHGGFAHFAEHLMWLMGYETLCYALYDQRDLVRAIYDKLLALSIAALKLILQFPRVKLIWASDDMGFKTGPMISPDDLRAFVLPGHKIMARMAHEAGRPYLLHVCGNITCIMDDLINDVQIDAKHSFEDTIEDVRDAKRRYGSRIALLGGMDVDFLCRATPDRIRQRVRDTLAVCLPGGGYCLGTGNTVANYIPLQNYLTMLDEGRRFVKP